MRMRLMWLGTKRPRHATGGPRSDSRQSCAWPALVSCVAREAVRSAHVAPDGSRPGLCSVDIEEQHLMKARVFIIPLGVIFTVGVIYLLIGALHGN